MKPHYDIHIQDQDILLGRQHGRRKSIPTVNLLPPQGVKKVKNDEFSGPDSTATVLMPIVRDTDERTDGSASGASGTQVGHAPAVSMGEAGRAPQSGVEGRRAEAPLAQELEYGALSGHKGYAKALGHHRRGHAALMVFIVFLVLIIVAAAGLGFLYWYMNLRKIDATIGGRDFLISAGTTYQELLTDGSVQAPSGDLLAIDGSLIKRGGGNPATLFVDGKQVTDLNAHVQSGADITYTAGTNVTEPSTTVSNQAIPFTYDIPGGQKFDFYDATLHLLMNKGRAGLAVVQTGTISGKSIVKREYLKMQPQTWVDTPSLLKGGQKVVALTFDDGPSPTWTKTLLGELQQAGVKATFFEVGQEVEKFPEVSRLVVQAGMQLACHSYSHASENYLNKLSGTAAKAQIDQGEAAIRKATGVNTTVVRPPGGNLDYTAVKGIGSDATAYVGWTIDTDDWQRPGKDAIVDSAVSGVEKYGSGSIVLMHDGGGDRSQTLAAVPEIIKKLKAEGYTFVTIDQLIQLKKAEL
jgi:peptidoglycan/xylan/chitin deacetylase (PgdA/CDA1 family)